METKNVSSELENILEALHEQGKQPSVALVKARLTTPVPMPAIIAAIKSWKSANRVPNIEVAAKKALSAEQRIEKLESLVAELSVRIEKLEADK